MLYITYDPTKHQDGAGAQLLRIVSAYLLSKYYRIGYFHTPIYSISNYGLSCLEEKKEDHKQLERYNALFALPSDRSPDESFNEIICVSTVTDKMVQLYKCAAHDKDILLKVVYPVFAINDNPGLLEFASHLQLPWICPDKQPSILKVAVHIRRGDILLIEKDLRYLPNSYYINIMKQIENILHDTPFEFHIYTENVTKTVHFTSADRTDFHNVDTILTPETYEEFNQCKNIVWHINTDPVDSFVELCQADILVISVSAYSYLAGVVNQNALVIYPPKSHHPPKQSWIVMDHNDSVLRNTIQVISHCNKVLQTKKPIRYISGGALGDFIHQLGIIEGIYQKTGIKGRLYISHSARASDKFPFGLEQAYNDTYKLISSQPYIESYHMHTDQSYDINLSSWVVNQQLFTRNWRDIFLAEYKTNWCMNKYLDIEHDVKYTDCIFISSSIKRFNYSINYAELCKQLPVKPIFITTVKAEYEHFKQSTGLDLECMFFDSLYDFYVAINSCKLFIGNLSSPTTIAQATMKPRITIIQAGFDEPDNIHMRGLDTSWQNCLFMYTSIDIYKVDEFIRNLFN